MADAPRLRTVRLAPNGSHAPAPGMTPARTPDSSLYCLFAVSLFYFWLSLMALKQASVSLGICSYTPRQVKRSGLRSEMYLPFFFGIFAHGTIRWVLLVLAYFTDASSSDSNFCDASCELRRAVLGDVPGFIFVWVFCWLFLHFLRGVNPDPSSMLPSRRRRQRSTATPYPGTVQPPILVLLFLAVLVWLCFIVFLSAPESVVEAATVGTVRDTIFLILFVVVVILGGIVIRSGCISEKAVEENGDGAVLRRLLIEPAVVTRLAMMVALTFTLRGSAVVYVLFSGGSEASSRPVLILGNMGPITLTFNMGYFVISEIIPAFVCLWLLRLRVFGDEHDTMLERTLLPSAMEIDPMEISLEHPIGAGGYGTVFVGKFRGIKVAIKRFHPTNFNVSSTMKMPRSRIDENTGRTRVDGKTSFLKGDASLSLIGGQPGLNGAVYRDEEIDEGYNDNTVVRKKTVYDLSENQASQRRARFVQEALLLCALRHPRIVTLMGYTYFPAEHSFALVMEHVEHGSLFDILHRSRGKLTLKQTLAFAKDISEGMCFLHASGVLHRDLKSANILVDGASRPKICDFGLSQEEQSSASMAEPSAHGTIAWAAPEVLHAKECTKASDVFSFAIVFYELLSRNIPYVSLPMAEVVIGVLGASRLRPSLVGVPSLGNPADPEAAAKVVRRLSAASAAARKHSKFEPLSLANNSGGYGTAAPSKTPTKTVVMKALDLLTSCWEQEPRRRPTFEEVNSSLSAMMAGANDNVLDLMVLQSR